MIGKAKRPKVRICFEIRISIRKSGGCADYLVAKLRHSCVVGAF